VGLQEEPDMQAGVEMIENRIGALLQSRWFFYIGAAAVTYMFWWSGLTKLWDHDFWNMQGQAAFVEKLWAQEHISVVGGLIVAAIVADLRSRRAK